MMKRFFLLFMYQTNRSTFKRLMMWKPGSVMHWKLISINIFFYFVFSLGKSSFDIRRRIRNVEYIGEILKCKSKQDQHRKQNQSIHGNVNMFYLVIKIRLKEQFSIHLWDIVYIVLPTIKVLIHLLSVLTQFYGLNN